MTDWHPVVAVPARNEERRIAALLDGLGRQSWIAGKRLRVVLVFNNCTDDSSGVAARAARRHPQLLIDPVAIDFPPAQAHVGSARRLALDRAIGTCEDLRRSVVMTTDADAVPDPQWVEANLAAIADGADIVGGKILGNKDEEARLGPDFLRRAGLHMRYCVLADRLASLIDPLPHDPWPRHRDHTGASLAVRADVYMAVGGLPALPFREDLAFVSRVRAAGYRLRHPLDVNVEVSARLAGRAPGGMADCLKDWMRAEAEGRPLLVEAPEAVAERLTRRRMLRSIDGDEARQAAARDFGVDASVFHAPDGTPFTIPELIERLTPDDPDAPAFTPAEIAIARIGQMIAEREDRFVAA